MNQLRGVQLPNPRYNTGPLSANLLSVNGYTNLQTFFPTLTKIFHLGKWDPKNEIWMDTMWKITSIDCSGTTGPCKINLQNNDASGSNVENCEAFLKAIHLLDPIQWIQGEYTLPRKNGLPWHPKGLQKTQNKLQDPENQAYIDTLCSYIVGRIREQDLSPHFNHFYGAFCAQASKYRYNLTDDFKSYKHESWLWKGLKKERFAFKVINRENPDEPIKPELLEELLKEYNDGDSVKSIVVDNINVDEYEECSIHSDNMSDVSFEQKGSEDSESEDDGEPEHLIYAEIPDYPVMIIITEKNTNTMDMLFDNFSEVGAMPGSAEWNNKWTAWLFQIVAALSVLQSMIGFTHNDLHSNNIVWSCTQEEYIIYKTRSGMHFKVPSYGKIFRIIDFGRAIFRINGQRFISDDFKKGNDADGQYVFSPLVQKFTKEIPPNPSFDLARLSVSIIDGIFPKKPLTKAGADILSKEPGLIVHETVSELYNLLWTWMIDDEGKNIFTCPNGNERFPDFDLYKHIAEFVHGAVPSKQFFTPAFQVFKVEEEAISGKVYSLFC